MRLFKFDEAIRGQCGAESMQAISCSVPRLVHGDLFVRVQSQCFSFALSTRKNRCPRSWLSTKSTFLGFSAHCVARPLRSQLIGRDVRLCRLTQEVGDIHPQGGRDAQQGVQAWHTQSTLDVADHLVGHPCPGRHSAQRQSLPFAFLAQQHSRFQANSLVQKVRLGHLPTPTAEKDCPCI